LEAVNTACHDINRFYLHHLLKKTSYELLTGSSTNHRGLVEVSSDVLFDKTNGSPRDQVDLDDVDDVPTSAMRTMAMGDVRPQEQQDQDQPYSSTHVHPPTQDEEQVPHDDDINPGGHMKKRTRRKKHVGVCFVAEDPKEINTFDTSSPQQRRSYRL
jgi:hypothetical protein